MASGGNAGSGGKEQLTRCDYCGRPTSAAGPMIEGIALAQAGVKTEKAFICSNCVEACSGLFKQHERDHTDLDEVPTPRELVEHLDEYIIGQDTVKKILAVAVVNHYKRVLAPPIEDEALKHVEVSKSNVMLIGPTGCGKTALAETLARRLHVPFAIGDATTLTEAGYVGEDVENLILKLVMAANYDIKAAERGIIYIDEIDKIGKTNQNVSITRDVSGEGVQQSLLKLLEGTVANVPPAGGRKHPEQQYLQVNTSNIMFICGGTFVGLEEIIAKRLSRKSIGFGQPEKSSDKEQERDELVAQVQPEDLERFGIIPELIGRLPVIASLNQLSVPDLARILVEPKNAITKQYQVLFHLDEAKLAFTGGAITEIAKRAKERKTGARGLRSIMEKLMLEPMFTLPEREPGQTYTVTEEVVKGEKPLIEDSAAQ